MAMRPATFGLLTSACLALGLASASAEPVQLAQDGDQTGEKSYDFEPLNSGSGATRNISRQEREIVQDYISGGRGSIAAWQSNLERLPPGANDELQPGAPMPPGIAPHGLPSALESALPRRRDEDWRVAGYNLLLIDRESGKIIDVLPKIFEPY